MPFIMNALNTPIHTQAQGKWFKWAPLQIKDIQNPHLALFFETNRATEGLIGIPEHIMVDPETGEPRDKKSKEFRDFIEERRREGVQKRIQFLDFIINNLEVSLRRDLEASNIKAPPYTFASKGELAAYKERAALAETERANTMTPGDEILRIKAEMEGTAVNGNITDTKPGADASGRANTVKPTASGK